MRRRVQPHTHMFSHTDTCLLSLSRTSEEEGLHLEPGREGGGEREGEREVPVRRRVQPLERKRVHDRKCRSLYQ